MLKELSKGRLFGHPIHPMLIHFPTALFSAGFVFDVGGLLAEEPLLFPASFYAILLGLAGGVLAGIFGFIDYIKLAEQPKAFQKASWHAIIQFCVLIIFGIVAGIKSQTYPDLAKPGVLQLAGMAIALTAMLVGNYLGGELVFTHKVGINR